MFSISQPRLGALLAALLAVVAGFTAPGWHRHESASDSPIVEHGHTHSHTTCSAHHSNHDHTDHQHPAPVRPHEDDSDHDCAVCQWMLSLLADGLPHGQTLAWLHIPVAHVPCVRSQVDEPHDLPVLWICGPPIART